MAVKIRLSRHGKKNYAFYHIIVADSRAPRDGRYIERIGSYNPNTNPANIVLDGEKALDWLNKGAQPTDTCRRILSHEGVLLKKHLEGGIKKGAVTEEIAEQKWSAWKAEKDAKVNAKKDNISKTKSDASKSALDTETKVNQTRAEGISKKRAEEALKAAEKEAKITEVEAAPVVEETPVATEAPAVEAAPVEEPKA